VPLEDRSRSSRRSSALRSGVTLWDRMGSEERAAWVVAASWSEVLKGWDVGSAEDCGAGGVGLDVDDIV